jgi:hypothetical protein
VAASGAEGDRGLSLQYQYHGHFFIIGKHAGQEKARAFIADILDTFTLADIDEEGFREALNSDMADFEDAVQYVTCIQTAVIRSLQETRQILATGPTSSTPSS